MKILKRIKRLNPFQIFLEKIERKIVMAIQEQAAAELVVLEEINRNLDIIVEKLSRPVVTPEDQAALNAVEAKLQEVNTRIAAIANPVTEPPTT